MASDGTAARGARDRDPARDCAKFSQACYFLRERNVGMLRRIVGLVALLLVGCSSDGVDPSNLHLALSLSVADAEGFASNGEIFALGAEESLLIYEIGDGSDATEVGRVVWPGSNGAPRFVAFSGDHIVVELRGALRIIDASDPSAPTELTSMAFGEIVDLQVRDGRAYVLADPGDMLVEVLHVIDLSNPSAPAEVGSAELSAPNFALHGDYAYGGYRNDRFDTNYPGQIQVVRVSPTVEAVEWTDAVGGMVHVDGDRLYVARVDGLDVHDLSNPSSPDPIHLEPTTPNLGGDGRFDSWRGWILRTVGPTVAFYPAGETEPTMPSSTYGGSRTNVVRVAHDDRFLYVVYRSPNGGVPLSGVEILSAR
ncbi:MAG: hypothetical protein R3B40_07805 [Polyangiales bacterium]